MYWRRRVARHVAIAVIGICFGALATKLTNHRSTAEAISLATAYAGLGLVVTALVIGPLNLLRRRPNPTSTDLRRDVGIWAGLFGITHTVAGFQVHMHGVLRRYLTVTAGGVGARMFVAANFLGVIAVILLIVLVSISNDIALRRFGAARWKALQRVTYVVIVAIVLHGAMYQIIEKRSWPLALIFSLLVVAAAAMQWAGARARKMRSEIISSRP
ncbi:MAG: ferric reductase-like transmembrane domain-containing protein [Gemmatimonadaceae bacterium]